MSIENSVSNDFDLHQSIVLTFRLPPIRCDEELLLFYFLFPGMGCMPNRNVQQNMGGMNQYGKMGMDGSRGMSNQMGPQSQMRSGIQSLMGSDMPSPMGSDMQGQMRAGMQGQMESNMQNQMGTGSMRNEMDRFSDQRGKNGRFSYSLFIPIIYRSTSLSLSRREWRKYFKLFAVRHKQNVTSPKYNVHIQCLQDILLQSMCSKTVPT